MMEVEQGHLVSGGGANGRQLVKEPERAEIMGLVRKVHVWPGYPGLGSRGRGRPLLKGAEQE